MSRTSRLEVWRGLTTPAWVGSGGGPEVDTVDRGVAVVEMKIRGVTFSASD